MCPPYIAEEVRLLLTISWVRSFVCVIPQLIWRAIGRSLRKENIVGSSSPGCCSSLLQSIVRPSRRGGVPVFSLPRSRPSPISCAASRKDGSSPIRPPARRSGPMCMTPFKKVPAVRTTERAPIRVPSARTTPLAMPASTKISATSPSTIDKRGSCFKIDCTAAL